MIPVRQNSEVVMIYPYPQMLLRELPSQAVQPIMICGFHVKRVVFQASACAAGAKIRLQVSPLRKNNNSIPSNRNI